MGALQALLILPLATALVCALLKSGRLLAIVHAAGAAGTVGLGLWVVWGVAQNGPLTLIEQWLRLDALSAWLLLIIVAVGGWAAWSSVPYLAEERRKGVFPQTKLREYYALFHAFWGTMLWMAVCDNLGLMWVFVEATTLSTAFLVAFYNEKRALEAAWKYVILSFVGIALALFGTLLVYFSSLTGLGEKGGLLSWVTLVQQASQLDPGVLKLAFALVLIGYGTKMGLAPMHTWLPDAHSQAPAPISALLSGVLLNCAFYALLRFHLILVEAGLGGFSSSLLLAFGLLTLGLGALFILVQEDYKRLLAYSSVENMGLVAVGFGFNAKAAAFGALLHLLYHALSKALLFLSSGFLYLRFGSKRIADVTGALRSTPWVAIAFFAGVISIIGVPPFGVFMSKFSILSAGFASNHAWAGGLLIGWTALAFVGFLHAAAPMVLGKGRDDLVREPSWTWGPLLALAGLLLIFGLYLPEPLRALLDQVLEMIKP